MSEIQVTYKWQPIETAPKDGARILLWGRYWSDGQDWFKEPLYGQFSGRRWEAWGPGGPFGVRPTHWTPLPEPPTHEASHE